jgi:hypothetical protein
MDELSRVATMIDPQTVAGKVAGPCALARQSFQVSSNTVRGYQELVEVLTRFVQHLLRKTGCGELPEELAFGKAEEALRHKGLSIKHVYDDVKRGVNGGLRRVFDIIGEQIEQEQVSHYLEYVLATEIDQMDFDEIEEMMTAYVQKFGKYLPFELRSVPALMANWKAVILETSSLMSRLRSYIGKP